MANTGPKGTAHPESGGGQDNGEVCGRPSFEACWLRVLGMEVVTEISRPIVKEDKR